MKTKITFFFFITFSVWSALPSAESLFRNASNQDITGNHIYWRGEVQVSAKEDLKNVKKRYGMTLMARIGAENRIEIVQYIQDEQGRPLSLVYRRSPIYTLMTSRDNSVEKEFFYGALFSLLFNDSRLLTHFSKKFSSIFNTNNDLLDREKLKLLKKYRYYLEKIKDAGNEGRYKSPLKSENEEEQEKINNIMNRRLITEDSNIKLVRENEKFFIKLDLGTILAKYSNDKHHLLFLSYENNEKFCQLKFHNYMLFNGTHELPEYIILDFNEDLSYLIKSKRLSHKVVSKNYFSNQYEKMRKNFKNKEKGEFPEFLKL